MKTVLYEIRYYLAATVLVLFLVPDHQKDPSKFQTNKEIKPISIIREKHLKNPPYLKSGSDWKSDIELQAMFEKEVKKDVEDEFNNLFPAPNRY